MAKDNGVRAIREIERKYEALDGLELLDPAGLLGFDTASGGPHEQDLTEVYFDTAELRLLGAGVTLRRREGGSDAGWYLKLPVGKDSSAEPRLPLERSPRRPPAELVALTRVYTRGAGLTPVAELTTRRRRWVLTDSAGAALAELVDDHVRARTMGRQTTTVTWREVQVALGEHGQRKSLDRIERRLRKVGVRRAGSTSTLGRLLAERVPAESTTPDSRARSAGEVVLAYLGAQALRLRRADPLVRQDVPDGVHQMRVAARRMRSALQAFGRVIDRDQTRELTAELKWMAGELSGARDAEVMAQHFAALLTGVPDELKLGPVAAAFTRSFERRKAQARDVALAALDSGRYLALHDRIDALLTQAPLTARAHRKGKRELPRSAGRAYRRLESRMADAQRQPRGQMRDRALHETRKAAKRLRYALEALQGTQGKPATRLRKRLKFVQDFLGEHQDTVVARPVLRELAAQAHLEGGNGFTYGLLYAAEIARAEQVEHDLPRAWQRMRKPKNTAWLKS